MAVKIDRQCRVITTRETGEDDALTVAAVREFAWSLNNYKAHVSSQKLISIFAPEDAVWSSGVDSNSERLAHCFAPRWVPARRDGRETATLSEPKRAISRSISGTRQP